MNKLARPFVILVEKFYPDAFVFAIMITFIVGIAAMVTTGATPMEVAVSWGDGLGGLLAFIAQISITIVTAHALAHTDAVRKGLSSLGRMPKNPWQAYALVVGVAGIASLFAWAFGLVVGALLARQVAMEARDKGMKLHYPLLVASAYAGFVIWHMGYSGSAPLFVATPGNAMEETIGGLIPVQETIFAWWNILTAAVMLVVIIFLMPTIRPRTEEETIEISDAAIEDYQQQLRDMEYALAANAAPPRAKDEDPEGRRPRYEFDAGSDYTRTLTFEEHTGGPTVAERLDGTRILTLLIGGLLLVYLVHYFATNGLNLTLDIVNWTFLCLGLLLSRSVLHYVRLIANASQSVGQIILQYPFYAGIMGIMVGTGFITVVSDWFTAISTTETLGFWAFMSAGILNVFVPSGGGQWAIQGPIFLEAANNLGASKAVITMGVAYGDQWTNMIQPFFTIPLLAIAGLHVRQIMGYTFLVLIAGFFIFGGGILLAGFLA